MKQLRAMLPRFFDRLRPEDGLGTAMKSPPTQGSDSPSPDAGDSARSQTQAAYAAVDESGF
jgi:hypothetical protein